MQIEWLYVENNKRRERDFLKDLSSLCNERKKVLFFEMTECRKEKENNRR
jgi:hypothetical protein